MDERARMRTVRRRNRTSEDEATWGLEADREVDLTAPASTAGGPASAGHDLSSVRLGPDAASASSASGSGAFLQRQPDAGSPPAASAPGGGGTGSAAPAPDATRAKGEQTVAIPITLSDLAITLERARQQGRQGVPGTLTVQNPAAAATRDASATGGPSAQGNQKEQDNNARHLGIDVQNGVTVPLGSSGGGLETDLQLHFALRNWQAVQTPGNDSAPIHLRILNEPNAFVGLAVTQAAPDARGPHTQSDVVAGIGVDLLRVAFEQAKLETYLPAQVQASGSGDLSAGAGVGAEAKLSRMLSINAEINGTVSHGPDGSAVVAGSGTVYLTIHALP